MKVKKPIRKLNFFKETVANLNSNEMAIRKGGLPPQSDGCGGGTLRLPCSWGMPCSFSICDTMPEHCTNPTQTKSGGFDPACQCPDPSSLSNC